MPYIWVFILTVFLQVEGDLKTEQTYVPQICFHVSAVDS